MAAPVEKALGGKYEILQKIREGGMGAIYKVRHRLLDEIRVIKVLKSDLALDDTLRQRFQNEAKFAIQLRHPNVAHLYDFSVSPDGRAAYIVMEYIDGVTLQELIAEHGPPTVGLACEIATQGLRAVSYLHQQGFVHRDIAADNLMLTRDFQGGPLVKLIDLGIAKGKSDAVNLTATGIFMGKVRYSPPELFKAKAAASALDERSDIYSFGVLLYELLTGRTPFGGDTFSEIVAGHLFRPPMPFEESDADGHVPEELRRLCKRALDKDPEKRISSAEELICGLEPFLPEIPAHSDELERAIQATTQLATPRRPGGGSTQDRLDRQFDINADTTPEPARDDAREQAIESAVTAILEKPPVAVTRPRHPDREDATLLTDPREVGSLGGQRARDRGVAAPEPDGASAVEATGEPDPAPQSSATPVLRSPIGLALAVGIVLATAAAMWGLLAQGRTPPPPEGTPIVVETAPRWQPSVSEPAASATAEVKVPEPIPQVETGVTPQAGAAEPPPPPPRRIREPASAALQAVASEPAPEPSPPPMSPASDVRRGELFAPDPGVTPPALVMLPPAVYPEGFAAPKSELDILVEVLVHEDGRVLTAKLAPRVSVKKRYRELALETSKRATFRPAIKQGVEGKMWTTIRVRLPAG